MSTAHTTELDDAAAAEVNDISLLQRADLVEPICWATLVIAFFGTTLAAAVQGLSIATWVTLAFVVPIGLALRLTRRDQVRAGAWLLVLTLYVLITLSAAWASPVLTIVHLYAVITMLAGLVLGGEALVGLSLLSAVLTCVLVVAEAQGLLPPPINPADLATPIASLLAGLATATWIVWRALASIQRAREGWKSSTADVQRVLATLEERVEQRTAALRRVNAQLHDEIQVRNLIQADLVDARDDAETATEAKTRFVANVSHEIRTPLNGILGIADLLVQEPLHGSVRRHVETIQTCGELMVGLINDVLDFSRLDAGGIELEQLDFSLAKVLDASLAPLRVNAARRKLPLELHVHDELPKRMRGDPTRLAQIVTNLVGNAVKFTPEGRVDVSAQLVDFDTRTGKSEVRICVTDTGIGMSEDAAKRVFEPFVQADSATTRQYGGTGLGLTISKEIVEHMGGTLSLTTELGRGSSFEFTLRFAPPATQSSYELRVVPTSALPSQVLQVLVVEDNPINMQVACAMLERLGHQTSAAIDGYVAIEMLNARAFDLVLLDCQMPGIDGLEVARRVRTRPGPNRETWIVALTAHSSQAQRDRVRLAGMNAFMSKPLRFEVLGETLSQVNPRAQAGSELPISAPAPAPAPAPASTLTGALDPAALDQLRKLEAVQPGLLAEMCRVFVEEAARNLEEMKRGHATSDHQAIAEAAHALKGSSYTVGAREIGDVAAEIETASRESQDIAEQLVALELAFAATQPTLDTLGATIKE